MKMTSATSYALHALAYLARYHEPVASHVVADQCHLPERFLLKILKQLVAGGIVASSKGPFGGYMLCKRPVEITLLEVIESVDGPILPRVAFVQSDRSRLSRRCNSLCQELAQNTRTKLYRTRLSELVE
jgi:Rrf2 family protein